MSLVSAHRCRVLCRAAVLLLGVLCSRTAFAQEQVEYYGTDAIGSVRIVFDASGTVTGRMDYGPFGEALAPATGLDPHVYAQLFGDAEIGKAFAQARHYSSITGRFLRTDPVFSGLDDPQRWNRYAYALNGPLRYVDRAGTKTCEVDFCSGVEIDLPGGGGSSGGSGGSGGGGGGGGGGGNGSPTCLLAPWCNPGGGGSDGTTPPPPVLSPPTPNAPTPAPDSSKPSDEPAKQADSCHSTAQALAGMSQGILGREDVVGWNMAVIARSDPWRGRATTGFREALTFQQGSDVYRHIWAYAGTTLAVKTGGGLAASYEFTIDVLQALGGVKGGRTEVLDDFAGAAVGAAMWVGNVTRNPNRAYHWITRVICK